ncbi:MAG: hypothetical protein ACR2MU_08480 [Gaiellaceae bacterium]
MADDAYLIFISKPTGYELHERHGEPPAVGEEIEQDEQRLRVSKLAGAPLPGDSCRCAYAQAL